MTIETPEKAPDASPICLHCKSRQYPGCDRKGWLAPLGPYRDGSYITSSPCPNDNPFAQD